VRALAPVTGALFKMKTLLPVLLVVMSSLTLASSFTDSYSVRLLQIYEASGKANIPTLPDLVDKEEKISKCYDRYFNQQSGPYRKSAQDTLYNLIYGPRAGNVVPYSEKLEELARLQCRVYYKLGLLK
jgi:hypothetical protein